MSVDKFQEWIPFNKDKKLTNDVIKKFHLDWIDKYPELRDMKLTSDFYNKTKEWEYTFEKKDTKLNIDLFLKITKYEHWSIEFESIINSNDKISIDDEKHYTKSDLDYEELNLELRKICEYLRQWNQNIFKEYNFYPLNE